jgi:hypothetical protein
VTSAKTQESMGKKLLIMHNIRHVGTIIFVYYSAINEFIFRNLRYHVTHD